MVAFVDQSAKDGVATDRRGVRLRRNLLRSRRVNLLSAVRPVAVVVHDVLGQYGGEMTQGRRSACGRLVRI